MSTETVHPVRGSTASSAVPGPRVPGESPGPQRGSGPPRHPLGSALRAVWVFLDTAFHVVVLGTDGSRQPDPRPQAEPPTGRM